MSEAEAAARLQRDGWNELPSAKPRSVFAIAFEVVREPMFLLLVACGVLYLFLGDFEEALMLLGFVVIVMGITFYQERKTERALEALRDLSSPRALVLRDREQRRIAGREVVVGDLLVLSEGDRVPADAVVISCMSLAVDESLLTGESVPVRKTAGEAVEAVRRKAWWKRLLRTFSRLLRRRKAARGAGEESSMGRPGGDDTPFLYSGTLVVQGQGIARVKATGAWTELGKIGKALQTIAEEDTLLQKETGRLVRNLSIVAVSLCVLVVLVFGLTRNTPDRWVDGLLAGITLAMATLPEEFPVVLTIFLALGAWRMSKKQVLTRRVAAVETLGAATVLCTDKTGTLTMNQMTVAALFADGALHRLPSPAGSLPESFHALAEFAILASRQNPFDPMEKAIHQVGEDHLARTERLHPDWTLVHEYPLSKALLAISQVWKFPDGQDFIIAAKGAPEAIADLCHFPDERRAELTLHVAGLADDGLRVLGVARARFPLADLPDGQHDFQFEFLGLIGLADPVRPTVPSAIRECYTAGIRVVMITGDYPGTARSIARQIGLKPADLVVTGPELDLMTDAELRQRVAKVCVFARVVPEQKLRLVEALKANGDVVAMTGDGVNDAPALKAAHIGIAMGGRGTDVARESAALVLLDDDFSSIVAAVKMGRRIFDNIQKAVVYIFAIHVPIAGLSLLPVLLGWPLILMPVHILFLELIIDPACSTVFEAEAEEADIMMRPPRNPKDPLFSLSIVSLGILQGFSVLLIIGAIYAIPYLHGYGVRVARAHAYTALIVANLCLILTNRSRSRTILETLRTPNTALWWVLGGAAAFLALVLWVPFLREIFRFAVMHPLDIGISLAAGILSIAWLDQVKRRSRARFHTSGRAPHR